MKMAIAQLNTQAGDFAATARRMADLSLRAADQDVELLVFPVATLTGQDTAMPFANRNAHQSDLLHVLEHLSSEVSCPCLVPVMGQLEDDSLFEAMLLRDGNVTPLRMRSYIRAMSGNASGDVHQSPADSLPFAPEALSPEALSTFEIGGLRMGLAFTYEDLEDLADANVSLDAVIYLPIYSYALDDAASAMGAALAESRLKGDALALDAWLVAAGSLGGYGRQIYTGSSFVLNSRGGLVTSAPAFEEALIVADVSADHDPVVPAPTQEPEIYNRSLHLWEALVLGLRDYVRKQGRDDVALVLDGRLQSCVLAALASDALGPTHVQALKAPVLGEQELEVANQILLALHLDEGSWATMGEKAPWASFLAASKSMAQDLAQLLLAEHCRSTGAVALAPHDKTFLALEVASSACRVAELLPFGDVYRTDVIELAHLRNTISHVIPATAFGNVDEPAIEGLQEAERTVELRLKRIDVTLATHIEWERDLTSVALRQGNPQLTQAIIRRLHETQASREAWPPCLVASSKPLVHARMPLGYAWHDHVRDKKEQQRDKDLIKRLTAALDEAGDQQGLQPNSQDFANMLENLRLELRSGVPESAGEGESVESALSELLGLLQDLVHNGDQPALGGPFGPLTWGSPFSEN